MTCKAIKRFCDKYFDTNIAEYNQSNESISNRWVYYILCRKFSFGSYSEIGRAVNRKHSAVISATKQADAMICIKDKGFISKLQKAENEFLKYHVLDEKYFEYDGLELIDLKRKLLKYSEQIAQKNNKILNLNKKIQLLNSKIL